MPLTAIRVGSRVRVDALPPDPMLQRRLIALGVCPGVELEVLRRGRPGGIHHIACGFVDFMLRREHARQIRVTPTEAAGSIP